MSEQFDFNERELLVERIRLSVATVITKQIWRHAKLEITTWPDYLAKNLILKLDAYISGVKLNHEKYFKEVPASWWQAFKETYFPLWAKRQFPVITKSIETLVITQYLLLPNVPVNMDRAEYQVRIADAWLRARGK